MQREVDVLRAVSLDLDGVSHPCSAVEGLQPSLMMYGGYQQAVVDRGLFRWLPKLHEVLLGHPDVCLVVHSKWRAILSNSDLVSILGGLGDRLLGVTDLSLPRAQGIEAFMDAAGVDSWVAIDDDVRAFAGLEDRLIVTDPDLGLADPRVTERLMEWLQDGDRPRLAAERFAGAAA